MPISTLEPTSSQRRLRTLSAIAAILAILQVVVAITMMATHNGTVTVVHEGLGYLYAAAAVVTVVPAVVWGRLSHSTGLIGHAAGMAVVGVVQLLLGLTYAPASGAKWLIYVHMALGLLIMLGAIVLYVRSGKRSVIVTDVDATDR
jgi:hypothetical protein